MLCNQNHFVSLRVCTTHGYEDKSDFTFEKELLTILNKSNATRSKREREVRKVGRIGRVISRDDGSDKHEIHNGTKIKEDSCVIRFLAIITKSDFILRWSKKESSGHSDKQSRYKHRIINTST